MAWARGVVAGPQTPIWVGSLNFPIPEPLFVRLVAFSIFYRKNRRSWSFWSVLGRSGLDFGWFWDAPGRVLEVPGQHFWRFFRARTPVM